MTTTKTKAQVIKDNSQFKSLINAVINQLGDTSYLSDISNHGVSGGFPGFTYYSDTVAFAHKNRKQIVELLEEQAAQLGEETVAMVASFGAFRHSGMDADDKKDLYRYLSGVKCKDTTIPNLMAWFAAEEVARMFED